jgi:SAM-dependent methyltransferase
MTTDYNQIADVFAQTKSAPLKQYSERWTFFNALKDVQGRTVLDLACGDGDYTRALKQQGAAKVVGVDVSEKMIARARELEAQQPLGIEYHVRDVADLEQLGSFDLVVAVYLFVYAETEERLFAMCRAAYANLVPGGRCLAVILNPELTEQHIAVSNRLGISLKLDGPIQDGATITIAIPTPAGPIELSNYYWSKPTYEHALQSAGFRAVEWHRIGVAPEALEAFGADFWRDYLVDPGIAIFECQA